MILLNQYILKGNSEEQFNWYFSLKWHDLFVSEEVLNTFIAIKLFLTFIDVLTLKVDQTVFLYGFSAYFMK